MRPGQNRRVRGRNRNKGPNPLTRTYESNGPDVKIRGTAQHVADKYSQLARDAQASGDPVAAENYFQHAEHYYRMIAAAQEQYKQQFGGFQRPFDEEGDEGDEDGPPMAGYGAPERGGPMGDEFGEGGPGLGGPAPGPGGFEPRGGNERPMGQRFERNDRGQNRNNRFDRNGERYDRGDRFNDRPDRFGGERGQGYGGDRGQGWQGGDARPQGARPDRFAGDRDRTGGERQGGDRFERGGDRFERPNGERPDRGGERRDRPQRNDYPRESAPGDARPERPQPQPYRAEPRFEGSDDERGADSVGLPAFLTTPVRSSIAVEGATAEEPARLEPSSGGNEINGARPARRRRARRDEAGESPTDLGGPTDVPAAE